MCHRPLPSADNLTRLLHSPVVTARCLAKVRNELALKMGCESGRPSELGLQSANCFRNYLSRPSRLVERRVGVACRRERNWRERRRREPPGRGSFPIGHKHALV
jgi:hypothetical protein